jgi:hypothetical protein
MIEAARYTRSDDKIMLVTIIPFTIIVNSLFFGKRFFTDWKLFVLSSILTFLFISAFFILCGWVAVTLRKNLWLIIQWMNWKKCLTPIFIFRISRSFYISANSVEQMHDYFGNRLLLNLKPPVDKEATVSREKVQTLKNGWVNKTLFYRNLEYYRSSFFV